MVNQDNEHYLGSTKIINNGKINKRKFKAGKVGSQYYRTQKIILNEFVDILDSSFIRTNICNRFHIFIKNGFKFKWYSK